MESHAFAVVALSILAFGLVSGRLEKTVLTPPMIFVGIGFLVGGHGLGWVDFHLDGHLIHTLAELTLVLILFSDAARIDLRLLRKEHDLPVRLLAIGMPLTIALGTFAAILIFTHFNIWEAALLAAILAPTDAALGQAVVSSPRVPLRIRQALNVESGLNDGIALPVILIMLAASCSVEHTETVGYWIQFTALQVTLGPLVGVLVGWGGGKLVERGTKSGWMNHSFQELSAIGLALLAFAGAEIVGGNGFIAAFCAGLALGNTVRAVCECLYEFAEAEGQLMTLLVFMVFGAVMVPNALEHLTWTSFLYAVLSLTAIRILPVMISMIGMKLRRETVFFLGWFGPRGLASILFGLLVVDESVLSAKNEILAIVLLTVLLSVIVHGLTAVPGAKWYAQCSEEHLHPEDAAEMKPVTAMPTRLGKMN